jgi:hypothetical protein
MNKSIKRTISGLAILGISTLGLAATAAPASAQPIRAHGTVTRAESNKIHRGVDKQACLSIREVQHIVGTKGKYEDYGNHISSREYKGKRGTSVRSVAVFFYRGCAFQVGTELTHGRSQATYNDENYPIYD